jgi:integrase
VLSKIPLLQPALDILEKYKPMMKMVDSAKLLPIYSNQKYNNYLKEVADLCGIEKNLTTHVARHTFATLMLSCK